MLFLNCFYDVRDVFVAFQIRQRNKQRNINSKNTSRLVLFDGDRVRGRIRLIVGKWTSTTIGRRRFRASTPSGIACAARASFSTPGVFR